MFNEKINLKTSPIHKERKKERNKGRKKEIRRNVYHIRKTPNEVQNLFQVEVKGAEALL